MEFQWSAWVLGNLAHYAASATQPQESTPGILWVRARLLKTLHPGDAANFPGPAICYSQSNARIGWGDSFQEPKTMKLTSSACFASIPTFLLIAAAACGPTAPSVTDSDASISQEAVAAAEYAAENYQGQVVETIGKLVSFKTVNKPGLANAENPEFLEMTAYLKEKADELGLDFEDHGAAVVIGLGDAEDRLGLVTHGDVQPADPTKWAKSPFELDRESEPDKLIGRGTEDDKGPIAMALYAMKALQERSLPLNRRVELIVSYTEESDWTPMTEFLENYDAPELNVVLDSRYPVVSAEKGFGVISLSIPHSIGGAEDGPGLSGFKGGAFISQVPEDASATIDNAGQELRAELERLATEDPEVRYSFEEADGNLIVRALGKAAHSSEPEEGVNAITHLAALLGKAGLTGGSSGHYVDFINRYVGVGHHGELFGDLAYRHDFMGPMTMSLGTLEEKDGQHVLSINLRMPAGKDKARLEAEIRRVAEEWSGRPGIPKPELTLYLGDPHLAEEAPHVPTLLRVYSHFTGDDQAEALSAGGGTHARLVPNGVSFGPHMPNRAYSGHTEHEHLALKELDLDLKMYAAMLVELAAASTP